MAFFWRWCSGCSFSAHTRNPLGGLAANASTRQWQSLHLPTWYCHPSPAASSERAWRPRPGGRADAQTPRPKSRFTPASAHHRAWQPRPGPANARLHSPNLPPTNRRTCLSPTPPDPQTAAGRPAQRGQMAVIGARTVNRVHLTAAGCAGAQHAPAQRVRALDAFSK